MRLHKSSLPDFDSAASGACPGACLDLMQCRALQTVHVHFNAAPFSPDLGRQLAIPDDLLQIQGLHGGCSTRTGKERLICFPPETSPMGAIWAPSRSDSSLRAALDGTADLVVEERTFQETSSTSRCIR